MEATGNTLIDTGLVERAVYPGADPGPLVCACFGVGLARIREAVLTEAATSPEAIGQLLRAGTNCGSCVPELKRIIAGELAPQAG